jgi:exosortase
MLQRTLIVGLFVIVGAYFLAFWPVVTDLLQTWIDNEDYSHGFFIIPVCCYLIWKKASLTDFTSDRHNWLGLLAVFLGLGLYLAGLFSQFRTLANLSFVFVGWASLFFLFGYHFFKKFGWELFLLIFMLPIPSRLYASITLPLQLIVTKISYVALQLFGIPVYREGNILQLANTTLEVVNACSGLRSILTIIVLAFVMACLFFQKSGYRIVLIAFAIPLAVLANLIRVIVIAVFAQYGNTSFIDGTGHTLFGLALFSLVLWLLFLVSRTMECILQRK